MGEEELRREIRQMRDQVAQLSEAIDKVTGPYHEVLGRMEELQEVARRYFSLLDLYQRYGGISPDIVVPGLRDPISREVVKVLFDKGDRNISQIAEAVRQRRGTASRRIVREKLERLVEDGVVTATKDGKTRWFSVSDEVVRKWSEVLGLHKYEGQPRSDQGKTEGE